MQHPTFLTEADYEFIETRKNGRLYQKLFNVPTRIPMMMGVVDMETVLSINILKTLYGRNVVYYLSMEFFNGRKEFSNMINEETLKLKIQQFEEKINKIATVRK